MLSDNYRLDRGESVVTLTDVGDINPILVGSRFVWMQLLMVMFHFQFLFMASKLGLSARAN